MADLHGRGPPGSCSARRPRAFAEAYAPKVGRRHPDFTLPRIDDRRPVSLSDLRGKKVLLIQFASW